MNPPFGTAFPGLSGQDQPPSVRMYELLYSSLVSQLLIATAELGVADHLADGALDVDELARRTDTEPGALYRALRALAGIGVFTEVAPQRFASNPLADTLRSDEAGSMRDLARYVGLPARQAAFGALVTSLRTGGPAFDHVHGASWWAYFAAHPELSTLFNRAMTTMSRMVNSSILEGFDFDGVHHLVDVGGGQGHLVAAILAGHPRMTATLLELPRVVPEAQQVLADAGVGDRVDCVGGDFLAGVPRGGDLYVVSWLLHDWNDEDSVTILRNIRDAMSDGAALVVIDEVLPEGDAPHFGKFEDIVMLALLTGRVRTRPELAALFEKAGLRLTEVRPTSSPTSVIVGVPS